MLKIRPVWKADELKRFGELEEKYHYMGETHSGGDTLRLAIEDDGEWVAIMVWGGACYHLLRRDEYIGWTPSLRARRLKLIASNRRFTILAKPGERRNLASQCLALAAREIPGLWMRKFHYRPLLAETFCDIEHSAGTCYKAAGWTPLGMTKGFTRTNRQECDFYVPNDRPKTLWVKPLVPNALELLNARELPADCALGAQGNSDGVMPIGKEQRESLYDALCRVRDTRDSNRTFHIGGMLSIVVMAMMSGANSVKAIARFAKRLDMPQRRELCMPHAKSKSGVVAKHEYKVPSYVTMYNFLKTLDLDDFAGKLTEWMSAQEGTLPRQLALDGKFVKEVMGVVSVVNVENGAPVAVAPVSRKEGETGKCEMPVGRRLLSEMDLTNALVCSDALHCQHETVRTVARSNGESLVQIKDNQKGLLRNAQAVVKARAPAASKKSRDGARTEGGPADAHIQAGRPGPARHVRDAHARADPAPVGAPVRTEQGEPNESGNIVPRLDHRNRRTAWRRLLRRRCALRVGHRDGIPRQAGLRLLRRRQNSSLQRKHHRRYDAGKDSGVRVHGQTRHHKLPGIQGRTPVRSRPAPADGRGCAFKLNHHGRAGKTRYANLRPQ